MPDAPLFARPSVSLALSAYDGFAGGSGQSLRSLTPECVDVLAALLLGCAGQGEACVGLWEKLLWDHYSRWFPRADQINPKVLEWPLELSGFEALEAQEASVIHDTEWLMATMMAAGFSPWEGDGRVVLGFLERGLHRLVKMALAWPQAETLERLLSTSRGELEGLQGRLEEDGEEERWGHWLLRVETNRPLWELVDRRRTSPPSLNDMGGACAVAVSAHAHWFEGDLGAQQELRAAWDNAGRTRSIRDEWLLAGLWNHQTTSEKLKERVRLTIAGELRGKGNLRARDGFVGDFKVVYDTAMEEKEDGLGLPFLLSQSWVEQGEETVRWSVVASRLVGRFLRRDDHCVDELPLEKPISTSPSPLRSLLETFGPVLEGTGPRGLAWSGLFALSFAALVEENEGAWLRGQVEGALGWSKWLLDQGIDAKVVAMAWGEWLLRFPESRHGHAHRFYSLMGDLNIVEVAPWRQSENEKAGFDWDNETYLILNLLGGIGRGWGKDWDGLATPLEWGALEEDEFLLAVEVAFVLGHPLVWQSLGGHVHSRSLPKHLLSVLLERLSRKKLRGFGGYGEVWVTDQDLARLKGKFKEAILGESLPAAQGSSAEAVRF